MVLKMVTILALAAVAFAVPVQIHHQQTPILVKNVDAAPVYYKNHQVEEYGPAKYQFSYQVHDEHTGDIKSQEESRHGDQVQGKYTLIDADGFQRIVEYTADKHSGFNAIVHREPIKGYKAPEPHHTYVHAAPFVKYVAPVAKIVAPVAKVFTPIAHHVVPHYQRKSDGHQSSHVSFSGPSNAYHY